MSSASDSEDFQDLEDAVENAPFSMDGHMAIIDAYRGCGEFDKLMVVRRRAALVIPFPERAWLEWIDDVKRFSEDTENVVKLYRRAIAARCGISFDLWEGYIDFVKELVKESHKQVQQLYEEALMDLGLHPTFGPKLYAKYRQFEQCEGNREHEAKVLKLFLRQLSVPLPNNDAVLEELKKRVDTPEIIQEGTKRYDESKLIWDEVAPLEEKIESGGMVALVASRELVELERKRGDPSRMLFSLLRAAVVAPGESQCWLNYAQYATKLTLAKALDALSRGVLEAPTHDLWEEYLLCLELNGKTLEQMAKFTEIAHAQGFNMFVMLADAARRKENEKTMRISFERAVMESEEGERADILLHWMQVEAYTTEDVKTVKDVGEQLMKLRPDVLTWRTYLSCLRHVCVDASSHEIVRTAYQGALKKFSELRFDYINFERQLGSLENYITARKTHSSLTAPLLTATPARASSSIGPTMGPDAPDKRPTIEDKAEPMDLASMIAAAPSAEFKVATSKEDTAVMECGNAAKRRKCNPDAKAKKRKIVEEPAPSPHYLVQKFGDQAPEMDEGQKTLYVGGLDKCVTEADLEDMFNVISEFKQIRLVRDFKGRSKGFAYADFESSKGVAAASKKYHQTQLHGCTITVLPSKPTKKLFDEKTVFVLNLPQDADAFFAPIPVVAVRRTGENRAYVDFENKEHVLQAIEKSGTEIDGVAVTVSFSTPMKEHRKQVARDPKDASRLDQHNESVEAAKHGKVLFVKNLAFNLTDDQLREPFQQYGEVKEVLLVKNELGKSRGFGYVEMADEAAAFSAMAFSGQEVAGRPIIVSRSQRAISHKKHREEGKGKDKGKGKGKGGQDTALSRSVPHDGPKPRAKFGLGYKPQKEDKPVSEENEAANGVVESEKVIEEKTEEPKGGLTNADFLQFLN